MGWGGGGRTATMTAETAMRGSVPKCNGSGWDRSTTAMTPLLASVPLGPPCALLTNILCGRREMARKILSCGNDDDGNGANYSVKVEQISWF